MADYNLSQTGGQVQQLLDTVAAGYIYMGTADLTTTPDTTNPNVCYILKAVGTYTNFGNIQHASGIGIALWNGTAWSYQNVPSAAVVPTDATLISGSTNPVQGGVVFDALADINDELNGRNIEDEIVWNNGFIATNGYINNSPASKFTQPFLLKKGETVIVGTNNNNIAIIGTTTLESLSVGNTITPLQVTGAVAQFETHTYTATEDIKIVLCVKWSEHTLEFETPTSIKEDIANIQSETTELESSVADIYTKIGDGEITKDLTWSDGYISTMGYVANSSVSKFTQPFLLKKGESVVVGTNNTSICIIGTTTAETISVADTITPIQTTSATAGFETHTYTATEDIKIVLCVKWSEHTLEFLYADALGYRVSLLENDIEEISGVSENVQTMYHGKEMLRDIINDKSNFTAFFFSDVHAQVTNMNRIVTLGNAWKDYLDVILNGGDTVLSNNSESFTWYDDILASSDLEIMMTIGNHDVLTGGRDVAYDKILAPTLATISNKVQPSDASTNKLCYYYKDFGNVRVISFDTANASNVSQGAYLDAENTWLSNVLSDAITNNKQVLILTHYPFLQADVERIEGCTWNSVYRYEYQEENDSSVSWNIDNSTCDVVDTFINNGGYFIGWVTGHVHYNNFITNSRHPKQVMYNIGSARNNYASVDMPVTNNEDDYNYDQFCYLGVDTTHHFLKLLKIGRNRCYQLRLQNTLCWDYANCKLISNN